MTIGEISISGKKRNTRGTLNFSELNRTLIAGAQMAADAFIITTLSFASLGLIVFLQHHEGIRYYLYLLPTIGVTVIVIVIFARRGVYDVFNASTRMGVVIRTIRHFMGTILLLTGCFFVFKVSDEFSRGWLTTWSVASAIALCVGRLITAHAVRRLIQGGRLTKNVAIVGASEVGQQLAAKFADQGSGTRLVGLFDERRSRLAKDLNASTTVHELSRIYELLYEERVDEIVIAVPAYASDRILELSRRFHPFAVSLRVLAPDGYENFQVLDSCRYGDIATFRVMGKPLDEVAVVIKRLEDIVIALSCLIVALPLMLLIALALKLDTPGPVLFSQRRLGANSLPFDLLKFRSMFVEQTDPLGCQLTRAGDPRITRVGRLLRRTSMDELPQLINVLRGDMSLVGPRPHPLAANAAGVSYARAIREYPIRHRVKPGITGWAQVNGWRGETTTIEQIRRRVEHDLHYIENWSLAFDLLILGRTVFTVLSRENAI